MEKEEGKVACKQCEAMNQKEEYQTKNRLGIIRSPRAELVQSTRALLCPLLLAYPHVVLVCDLELKSVRVEPMLDMGDIPSWRAQHRPGTPCVSGVGDLRCGP